MKTVLEVKGMTCGSCVKKVNKIISGFAGISDVSVDLQRMEACFECNAPATDVAGIVQAINDFGFTAREKA
jgi:copper chaperone